MAQHIIIDIGPNLQAVFTGAAILLIGYVIARFVFSD